MNLMSHSVNGFIMNAKFILLLLFLIGSCAWADGHKNTIQGTAFSGGDYTLTFPSSWEVKRGVMGTDLMGISPLENQSDEFQENVCVILDNLPDTMDAQMYLQSNLDAVKRMYGLPEGAGFARVRVGNTDGYHIRCSVQVGQRLQDNDTYIIIIDKAVYTITCSHLSGKRDAYKTIVDSIISSFTAK